jgi:methylmalonyl-CoA mutase cobalamin-binding subunit
MEQMIDEIVEQGLQGIVLDIVGLGGEIPPAARAEPPEDGFAELPPGQ